LGGTLAMFKLNKISRQILILTLSLVTVFSFGISALIGFQSFNDMKDIALQGTQSAAKFYEAELKTKVDLIGKSLSELKNNFIINEQLELATQYGPLYSENQSSEISDSDAIFYFQSQLKLARSLIHLLTNNDLGQLTVHHIAPYNQFKFKKPLPSIIITADHIWLYRYPNKSANVSNIIYKLPIKNLHRNKDAFDLTSIYDKDPDYFYSLIGAEKTLLDPRLFVNKEIDVEHKNSIKNNIHRLNNNLIISIAGKIPLYLTNPDSWVKTIKNSLIIEAIYIPSANILNNASDRMGADLAIVDDEHIWITSRYDQVAEYPRIHNKAEDKAYIHSEFPISIGSDTPGQFKIMAKNSTVGLKTRVNNIILRLFLIALVANIIIGISLYALVNKILRKPLANLVEGVDAIHQGQLDYVVNIEVSNELSSLGSSFNEMTSTIKDQRNELRKINESLENKVKQRTEELQYAQQQLILADKMATLGQLVAGIAHEINTPLGNAITALSFSEQELVKVRVKFSDKSLTATNFSDFLDSTFESLGLVTNNLSKAIELVQTFKKVAVNQSIEELTTFSLEDHIQEVLITLRPQLKQSTVNVTLDLAPGLFIKSYQGAYYHILSNMITNSLRHAFPDKKGNIHLSTELKDQVLIIIYQDDGVGMPGEIQPKIFEPFFTTRRGDGGTGLGMYMTYNIVTQRLGGSIEVESLKDKGLKFTLILPIDLNQGLPQDSNPFSIDSSVKP
jgi:signal transduction histidine kinase